MAYRAAQRIIGLAGALALWLGVVAVPGSAQDSRFPIASDSRLAGDETRTRFVMDLTRKIELRAFTLADPYRVVLDLPQVSFNLAPRTGDQGRGLVSAFRFGLVMQGGSRIVLDLKKPVRIERAFVLDPAQGQPARLVLDLVAVDRATFLQALATESRPKPPAPAKGTERQPVVPGDPRPIVVLDPGHGGIDRGASSPKGGIAEKDIVLDFGLILRDQLEETGRYRVVMTRSDDTFITLGQRIQIARDRGAHLFISIHADALRRGQAQGATVYTLSETASDRDAARLAEDENKADVISGIDLAQEADDVAGILFDLARRETKAYSTRFARTLVGELKSTARLHRNPLRSAGFKVLRSPDVPSVLLELGYVSNEADLKQLMSQRWRERTSRSMVQAIDAFFEAQGHGPTAVARPRLR